MSHPTARTRCTDDLVEVTILDPRPDTRTLLADLDDDTRTELAADAWRIGLRALGSALVQARESRLEDIGARLEVTLQEQISRTGEEQRQRLADLLTRFFDPEDGALPERLNAFVEDDGDLERMLRQHLAGDNSTLAQTLAARVGETLLFAQAADLPVLCESVGASVGAVSHCKVGDGLLPFTPDGPLPGSKVVVEIKRDRSFTATRALEELQKARENHLAQVGLFVMASTHTPAGFPPFARYGQDVLLVWDPESPGGTATLRAALLLCLGLLARSPTRSRPTCTAPSAASSGSSRRSSSGSSRCRVMSRRSCPRPRSCRASSAGRSGR